MTAETPREEIEAVAADISATAPRTSRNHARWAERLRAIAARMDAEPLGFIGCYTAEALALAEYQRGIYATEPTIFVYPKPVRGRDTPIYDHPATPPAVTDAEIDRARRAYNNARSAERRRRAIALGAKP